ncbi:unnamed protein product [Malus baccata var. baccata]
MMYIFIFRFSISFSAKPLWIHLSLSLSLSLSLYLSIICTHIAVHLFELLLFVCLWPELLKSSGVYTLWLTCATNCPTGKLPSPSRPPPPPPHMTVNTLKVFRMKITQSKDERPKRSRATELHNMSERMRRNKIRGKLKVLQELIPNCNKVAVVPRMKPNGHMCSTSSRCVDHVGRVENESHIDGMMDLMMSMGGGAVYQTPNLSLAGIQGTQMSQFKPYLPMGPGLGTSNAYEIGMGLGMAMGMINMCYTTGVPTMSVHSATAGLPLMSEPGGLPVNPQVQMQIPFLASQVMPSTTAATSNMVQPRFPTNFSRIFNYANQAGESSSPNTASDNEKVPFINQKSKVMASHVVTPTSN